MNWYERKSIRLLVTAFSFQCFLAIFLPLDFLLKEIPFLTIPTIIVSSGIVWVYFLFGFIFVGNNLEKKKNLVIGSDRSMNWEKYENRWNKLMDYILDMRKIIVCVLIGFIMMAFAVFTKIYIVGQIGILLISSYFFLMMGCFFIGGGILIIHDDIQKLKKLCKKE